MVYSTKCPQRISKGSPITMPPGWPRTTGAVEGWSKVSHAPYLEGILFASVASAKAEEID